MTISKTTITQKSTVSTGLAKFLLLTIAFTFALSVNYIFAAWTGPKQAPPLGNTPTPVHVGATNQVKDAGLSLNSLAVFGNGLFKADVTLSNLTDCDNLATDSNGKIVCNVPPPTPTCTFTYGPWSPTTCPVSEVQTRTVLSTSPPGCTGGTPVTTQLCTYVPPPVVCVPGSQDFLTPGEYTLAVNSSMQGCKFSFTLKGGSGSGSGANNGPPGGGIIISDITVPQTGSSFGILVGDHWSSSIGGGGHGPYGQYGGGASAVKLNSTVLAIVGGGGGPSYYTGGGAGGAGNSPGEDGKGYMPGKGGSGGTGGAAGHVGGAGGDAGNSGQNSVGVGGLGYPAFMVGGGGGGGNVSYQYGAGGGGGYGGGGGGGAGCAGWCNYGGGGGGGGYLDTDNVPTYQVITIPNRSKGSVTATWSE